MKRLTTIFFVFITIFGIYGAYKYLFNQARVEHVALASLNGRIIHAKTVEIVGFAFNPPEINIPPGGSVIFVNRDRVDQSATSDDGATFDTDLLKYSDSVKITIDKPGLYIYHSKPYPYIKGRIVVE